MNVELIKKYNVPGPRYTSYPTVPYWDNSPTEHEWKEHITQIFTSSNTTEGISIYIHLPFCENLCTFCGCHKRITKQHGVESPYIQTVLKEWELYCLLFDEKPRVAELHLGGGTPTFFTPENLQLLINGFFEHAIKLPNAELSFEGHPNNTTEAHLKTLREVGFNRSSFGVQDYNIDVQKAINRIQPFENVKKVTELSRKYGYHSISHDLVFGLPFQTKESIVETINKTAELLPDRIAYYGYAHVPWIKGVGQRGYNEKDLPKNAEKRELYEIGKQRFAELGYVEIGMDHFALKTDSMYKSMINKDLHRNFMGYTASKTKLMIGLGMSAISDSWNCFTQNEKTVEAYTELVNQEHIPIFRGHQLTKEDLIIRKHILDVMCQFKTEWNDGLSVVQKEEIKNKLAPLQKDGLVKLFSDKIEVTELGKIFVRNICMCFDLKLNRNTPKKPTFSKTI